MHRNISDNGKLFKETKLLMYFMGMLQILICSLQKKHNSCINFKNILLFNFVNLSKPQKVSAKPNCFWELGSRVPPLFPALVGGGDQKSFSRKIPIFGGTINVLGPKKIWEQNFKPKVFWDQKVFDQILFNKIFP